MIPYGKQEITQHDIDAVVKVLKSDFLTQGPQVPLFEEAVKREVNAEYAIAVNSATSALHIACLALGVVKGDVVWTIKPQHVAFIGKFFATGNLDLTQTIVVAGSEVKKPAYYTTKVGAQIGTIVEGNIGDNVRVISGNVLTGTKIAKDGYLSFFDNQITVIPEGDEYELLGWLFPSYPRPTISSSLPISKFLKRKFKVNTNPHGEPRAYVVTGQYEQVMPMDIMPQQLIKAIMAKDLELMENLGIYEVIEEDMALCEFVCTSKVDVQRVLSEGLELMAEES